MTNYEQSLLVLIRMFLLAYLTPTAKPPQLKQKNTATENDCPNIHILVTTLITQCCARHAHELYIYNMQHSRQTSLVGINYIASCLTRR